MAKRLYVGNLSYDTRDEGLKEAFSAFGSVESATVIMDKMSGRSKGFGFVEMSDDNDAEKAIEALNGKDCSGRPLKVNEARPREANGGGGGGGGGSRGPRRGGSGGGGGGFGGGRNRY